MRICELCKQPWNKCAGHGRASVFPKQPLNTTDARARFAVRLVKKLTATGFRRT